MDLIKSPNMSAMQFEGDSLDWYVYAQTPWNKDEYFILNLENNHAKAGLIRSETNYDSAVVSLIDDEIEKIITDEELVSPGGAFARIARGLDERRWSAGISPATA